jgi:hypothetical protein
LILFDVLDGSERTFIDSLVRFVKAGVGWATNRSIGVDLMAKRMKLSVLGVTMVTPALIAGNATAHSVPPPQTLDQAGTPFEPDVIAAQARLKSGIFELTPAEKLQIAGFRVPLFQPSASLVQPSEKLAGNHTACVYSCSTNCHIKAHNRAHAKGKPAGAPPSSAKCPNARPH